MIRKIPLFAAILIAIYVFSGSAYGASEFLLKNTADKKYSDFASCLKINKNLFTQCLDELKEYISSENKYIKVKKTDDSKNRLRKVVKYIKQSTDIYIQKAIETNELVRYNQAAIAATLLTKLSPSYKVEYASFLKKASIREQGKSASIALSSYYKKIREKEPDFEVIRTLINKARPYYDGLDTNIRNSLDKYFAAFVDRYYDYLVEINDAIEHKTLPEVSKLQYRYHAYSEIIEIEQIDPRRNDIAEITQQISDTSNQHFIVLTEQAEDLNTRFVSGQVLEGEEIERHSHYIRYFLDLIPVITRNREFGFGKVPQFPQTTVADLTTHRSFYLQSLAAQEFVDGKQYSESLRQQDDSLSDAYQTRLREEAVRRINQHAISGIDHYNQIARTDPMQSLSLLLSLPIKNLSDHSKNQRNTALDQYVGLLFAQIDRHVENDEHTVGFEILSEMREIYGYLDKYGDLHRTKRLDVLDNFAETLFSQIPGRIKNHDYDTALSDLAFAEQVSGYVEGYEEQHQEVVHNVRMASDIYWLTRIMGVAKGESLVTAIAIIDSKMFDFEKKQLAAEKIVDFIDRTLSKLFKTFKFEELSDELKSFRASGYVAEDRIGVLDESIRTVYQRQIVSDISRDKLVLAASHIFDDGNRLTVSQQRELTGELIRTIEVASKTDPEPMVQVLMDVDATLNVPTEAKQNFDELAVEIVGRWANKISKNGIQSCKEWKVLTLAFEPALDWHYIAAPPIGGPAEKGNYYLWPCEIIAVYSANSFFCDVSVDSHFLVDGVNQSFPQEIRQGGTYLIMGKYNKNKTNIFNQLVPVLENTYVSACF
jgi:hypothetical protein